MALDTRLWLVGQMRLLRGHLRQLIAVAVERAEREADVVMPGFTHLQPAQTVRWSHWVLCHAAAWQRDDQRLAQIIDRCNTLPLGSGALAGNPFGVDRRALAADLLMSNGVCPNSMDAVSDRDYVAELQFWAALLMTHLSRFSEDLIIYSSLQFGFVAMSDAYSTGSSLMPQKKNPDALELLRGKSGRLLGNLTGTLAVLKGTPTTYNKDFQEVWEPMYDTVDTMADCIQAREPAPRTRGRTHSTTRLGEGGLPGDEHTIIFETGPIPVARFYDKHMTEGHPPARPQPENAVAKETPRGAARPRMRSIIFETGLIPVARFQNDKHMAEGRCTTWPGASASLRSRLLHTPTQLFSPYSAGCPCRNDCPNPLRRAHPRRPLGWVA